MADALQQIIAAQAREIDQLKAARNVPNTAAADLANILDCSNITLQSDKSDLEVRNAALVRDMAVISQRNAFVEAELVAATHLFQQTIGVPGDKRSKQPIKTLQTLQTLKQEIATLQQLNAELGANQATILSEHASLHRFCKEWSEFSARQGMEIEELKKHNEALSGSCMRKLMRLEAQQKCLDKAGIVVKDPFEEYETNGEVERKKKIAEKQARSADDQVKAVNADTMEIDVVEVVEAGGKAVLE